MKVTCLNRDEWFHGSWHRPQDEDSHEGTTSQKARSIKRWKNVKVVVKVIKLCPIQGEISYRVHNAGHFRYWYFAAYTVNVSLKIQPGIYIIFSPCGNIEGSNLYFYLIAFYLASGNDVANITQLAYYCKNLHEKLWFGIQLHSYKIILEKVKYA